MAEIQFSIKDCMDCPFCKAERMCTEDSFEEPYNYYCKKADLKQIATYIEWRSEMPPVPDWCPCKPGAVKSTNTEPKTKFRKVKDFNVGELINIINGVHGEPDGAGPFIKTAHSLIDNTGSNWHLCECGNLDAIPAKPENMTFNQANEFRFQVISGEHLREVK